MCSRYFCQCFFQSPGQELAVSLNVAVTGTHTCTHTHKEEREREGREGKEWERNTISSHGNRVDCNDVLCSSVSISCSEEVQ